VEAQVTQQDSVLTCEHLSAVLTAAREIFMLQLFSFFFVNRLGVIKLLRFESRTLLQLSDKKRRAENPIFFWASWLS
jgi:hypothetical protein